MRILSLTFLGAPVREFCGPRYGWIGIAPR